MTQKDDLISLIIPTYKGAKTLSKLVDELILTFKNHKFEIIIVNDSSPDSTHIDSKILIKKYPNKITYLKLSKNFGEHNAVIAGLRNCEGQYAIIMDDDYQKSIATLYAELLKLDFQWIFIGDEFGMERKMIFIEDIIDNKYHISNMYRNLYTPKNEVLYSAHWDSHFTLLSSSKENIDKMISQFDFEGFYCNEKTEIYWSVRE